MTAISTKLRDRILSRLQLHGPLRPDLETLQRLYHSWCLHVPFDNLRKTIALKSANEQKLPGLDVSEFFEQWLNNGCGATCWPVANAFYELLMSLGFNASRITGNMRDLGIINHGSVKVAINNQEYLAEASLLLQKIYLLTEHITVENDPIYPVEIEKEDESYLLWMLTPPNKDYFYCRLSSSTVNIQVFDERYEASRERSIFNRRLYARKNYLDKLIILWGNSCYEKTSNGIFHKELSRNELYLSLKNDIGISNTLIKQWIDAGCMEASFEKTSDSPPPPVTIKPPSQRFTNESSVIDVV